jgi:thioredoxin 2
MFAPTFEETSILFPLKAQFVKIDTQEEQFLGSRFKIRSIPTLVVFKNAKEVQRVSGAMDINSLEEFINRFV